MHRLKTIIFTGFLTLFVLGLVFSIIKGLWILLTQFSKLVTGYLPFSFFGSEVIILFVLILILGTIIYVWQSKTGPLGKLIIKIPFIGNLIKFLTLIKNTISSQSSKEYKKKMWVLAEFNPGIYKLGLTIGTSLEEINKKTKGEKIVFFWLSSPSPITGFIYFVPREKIIPLDISFEVGLQLVVGAGMLKIENETK